MRPLKAREIVEIVVLHALCTHERTELEGLPEAAKRVATRWAELNKDICDQEG